MLHKDLKQLMEDACFAFFGKLFQTLAPLYEKHFCPFNDFFLGICTSESVFLRLWDEEFEYLVKKSIKYWGANLLTDLNAIVSISRLIRSSMVSQPKLRIEGKLGAS